MDPKPKSLLFFALTSTVLLVATESQAGDRVQLVEVPTQQTLPVFHSRGSYEESSALAAVESIRFFGEGATVDLILGSAPHLLGVKGTEAKKVRRHIAAKYRSLQRDPDFLSTPSPLSSAFERQKPQMLIVTPKTGKAERLRAPVVVFLHGYGGNGKLFAFMLADALPGAWIVAPSHGLTWRKPNLAYLSDALEEFQRRTRVRPKATYLVGLSDGGWGAFSAYSQIPNRFDGLVTLAATPPGSAIKNLPEDGKIWMFNGRRDSRVSQATVRKKFSRVKKRVPNAQLTFFEGGHYFLIEPNQKALSHLGNVLGLGAPVDHPRHPQL
jgi:predicted esterase